MNELMMSDPFLISSVFRDSILYLGIFLGPGAAATLDVKAAAPGQVDADGGHGVDTPGQALACAAGPAAAIQGGGAASGGPGHAP